MKKFIIGIMPFLLVGLKLQGQVDHCLLVQKVLGSEHTANMLKLKIDTSVTFSSASIRIFDQTGVFTECSSFTEPEKGKTIIPVYIIEGLKPDINSGLYRDIVFSGFRQEKDVILLIAVLSNFDKKKYSNGSYIIEYSFSIDEQNRIVSFDESIREYSPSFPIIDYGTEKYEP
jgi:hypothetical protein